MADARLPKGSRQRLLSQSSSTTAVAALAVVTVDSGPITIQFVKGMRLRLLHVDGDAAQTPAGSNFTLQRANFTVELVGPSTSVKLALPATASTGGLATKLVQAATQPLDAPLHIDYDDGQQIVGGSLTQINIRYETTVTNTDAVNPHSVIDSVRALVEIEFRSIDRPELGEF